MLIRGGLLIGASFVDMLIWTLSWRCVFLYLRVCNRHHGHTDCLFFVCGFCLAATVWICQSLGQIDLYL